MIYFCLWHRVYCDEGCTSAIFTECSLFNFFLFLYAFCNFFAFSSQHLSHCLIYLINCVLIFTLYFVTFLKSGNIIKDVSERFVKRNWRWICQWASETPFIACLHRSCAVHMYIRVHMQKIQCRTIIEKRGKRVIALKENYIIVDRPYKQVYYIIYA